MTEHNLPISSSKLTTGEDVEAHGAGIFTRQDELDAPRPMDGLPADTGEDVEAHGINGSMPPADGDVPRPGRG